MTNALSQTTTRNCNDSVGEMATLTDPNGLATSWGYDAFGRRTSEVRPDLTSTAWTYASCGTCDPRVRYVVQQQSKTDAGAVIRTDE